MNKISFQILGSSSSGNCSVLRTPLSTVLIDAGFSGKKTSQYLGALGLSFSDIDAVFFTHEHSDHCDGARALSRCDGLQFFANRATAEQIDRKASRRIAWNFFETGTSFKFRDLRVTTFSIPHDAADPVGFVFAVGDSAGATERLAWLTDCGKITGVVRRAVADVNALVLESNYDGAMLANSGRPAYLIQRIRSSHGHLSNAAAAEFLSEYENPRLEKLLLAHVSRDCNTVPLVRESCDGALGSRGVCADVVDPMRFLQPGAGWGF